MYGGIGGGALSGAVPTVAGITVLPNTGGNDLLMVASIVSITVGSIILLSTIGRLIAKVAYKA